MRAGDTLVVPKLDRLARSVPDARAIADRLRERGVKLALGRALYDPGDPMGKMFFNILATFAEFEADLIRMRTREGMAIARARGKLRGKQPKLSDRQQRELWGGRPRVRTVLYMGTLAATRCNPVIQPFYQRLLTAGKSKKLALTACMRKLLTILNIMVRNGQHWSPTIGTP